MGHLSGLLQLLAFTTLLLPCIAQDQCVWAQWWSSFDKKGMSTCGVTSSGINGIYRYKSDWIPQTIIYIDQANCCPYPDPYQNQPIMCSVADWQFSMGSDEARWSECPPGHFLEGLYNDGKSWSLHSVSRAKCCKPATHPYWYGHCYDKDLTNWHPYDTDRYATCKDDYKITAMYKEKCNELNCMTKWRCCKVVPKPPPQEDMDEIKERVMDLTMKDVALLAHYMGFEHAAGCATTHYGEDFRKYGDSWLASTEEPCNGVKPKDRLKIHYTGFSFDTKDVKFGDPVIVSINPEIAMQGRVQNLDKTPLTHTVSRTISTSRTVTHVSTSETNFGTQVGLELVYVPPFGLGPTLRTSVKVSVGGSVSNSKAESTTETQDIKVVSSKNVAANSTVRYRIIISKTRSTVPYTMRVLAKFNIELDGWLRDNDNYHSKYAYKSLKPSIKYKFGNAQRPFYKDLERQFSRSMLPWLWTEMRSTYPKVQDVVKSLTHEGWYEFMLTGQFEDVYGQHADVYWEDETSWKEDLLPKPVPKDSPKAPPFARNYPTYTNIEVPRPAGVLP